MISASNTVAVMGLAESVKTTICTSAHQEASMSAVKPVDVNTLKEGEIKEKVVEGSKGKQKKPYQCSAVYDSLLFRD